MLRTKFVSGAVLCSLTLPALPAFAAPDEAAAEALFRSGRQLMTERKYAEGCPKLAESFRLDPSAGGTQLALALCYEQWGKLASAWSTYTSAADLAKQQGRADRERAARQRADALEPKLSTLTINVDPSVTSLSGLKVTRNGAGVGSASFGVPLPVDPEEITVEASATDRRPWSTKIVVGPNAEKKSVTVPPLEEEKKGSVQPDAPQPAAATTVEQPTPPSSGMSGLRVASYALGGAGIVALGVGGFFGLRAIGKNSDSEDKGCKGSECPTLEGKELRDDARSAGNTATVATIAGGVLVAAGVTLFIIDRNKKSAGAGSGSGSEVRLAPVVGRGDAGLALFGRF